MTLAPGTKPGPHQTLEPIEAGGMGEVWKARDMPTKAALWLSRLDA